jgi:DMSO/TMAO reductase YedYZ molybdopterin-dependent catalytic subunit
MPARRAVARASVRSTAGSGSGAVAERGMVSCAPVAREDLRPHRCRRPPSPARPILHPRPAIHVTQPHRSPRPHHLPGAPGGARRAAERGDRPAGPRTRRSPPPAPTSSAATSRCPASTRRNTDSGWKGAVREPVELGLAELAGLPFRRVAATLECAGNGRVAMEPLPRGRAVERRRRRHRHLGRHAARRRAGARRAPRRGGRDPRRGRRPRRRRKGPGRSPSRDPLPREKALDPDTLLAREMNGASILPEHGGPLRLVVPGWYGMASVKWVYADRGADRTLPRLLPGRPVRLRVPGRRRAGAGDAGPLAHHRSGCGRKRAARARAGEPDGPGPGSGADRAGSRWPSSGGDEWRPARISSRPRLPLRMGAVGVRMGGPSRPAGTPSAAAPRTPPATCSPTPPAGTCTATATTPCAPTS